MKTEIQRHGGAVVWLLLVGLLRAEDGLNPFRGRQEREAVFEFAQKPSVRPIGSSRYKIAFATKAACDATVAVVLPGAG
ncbi:MAG: hypothetical protein N2255_07975, partial [Kiritimatiellae bacterium]|nr:hypothetical protein [Kiritimatiellia bacterium]